MKRQISNVKKNAPHLCALSLAIAMALSAPALPAATIVVSSNADPGTGTTCTLRQAVVSINTGSLSGACANSGAAFGTGDTINFSGVSLVQLDGSGWGELDIDSGHDLAINGGAGGVTIQLMSGAVSVIAEPNPNVVANLTLTGLTITGGNSPGNGGGVYLRESTKTTLTLNNCTVTGNTASGSGGGVYAPYVVLNNTVIGGGNHAGEEGGGVAGFIVIATNSSISGNTANGNGGGIESFLAELTNSTVSGNTASDGGGTYNLGIYLTNSTVSGNSGNHISGLFAVGGASLYNSTVSGNTTTSNSASTALFIGSTSTPGSVGGAIAAVQHSLHTTTAGVHAQAGRIQAKLYSGPLVLVSSIVSSNNSPFDIVSPTSIAAAGGHNLLGNVYSSIDTSGLTNEATGNPLLSPLANNGCAALAGAPGSTACVQTMALQVGSPAINAGSDPLNLSTDERGVAFARVFGAAADIGSFEVQAAATTAAPALSLWALLALLAQFGFTALYKLRQIMPRRPES